MVEEPRDIERDIVVTREQLGRDMDDLTDRANPKAAVRRRTYRVRASVGRARDRVMGTSGPAEQVRRQSEGNPLAVGLIAFGAGWLVASMFPATQVEREAAGNLTDAVREPAQAGAQRAKELAAETAGELREPAREAVGQVKASASTPPRR